MSKPVIQTPRGAVFAVKTSSGTIQAELRWNPGFAPDRTRMFVTAQEFIDNEVLRRCDKYVPLRTGVLKTSGVLGTIVGNGEVAYLAPYASHQYYHTAKTRRYAPLRGAYWFERMKGNELGAIRLGVARLTGAKNG